MKYVYKTGLGYDSEVPYTSYTAWIRDTYGKNGVENFWNTAQNIVYNTEDTLASLQNLLDYGGMIPVFGEPLDGINAVIYFVRGDKVNAALSAGAIVPFIGNGVTGVKIAKKGAKAVDNVFDVVKSGSKLYYKLKPQDLDWRGSGKLFKDALEVAFSKTGVPKDQFQVTKWGKDINGKSIPVEWKSKNGAEVSMDWAHDGFMKDGVWQSGPDAPHIGWQTDGKKNSIVGHIILDNVPSVRPPKK